MKRSTNVQKQSKQGLKRFHNHSYIDFALDSIKVFEIVADFYAFWQFRLSISLILST